MNYPGFDRDWGLGESYLVELKMNKIRAEPEAEEGHWKNWYEL